MRIWIAVTLALLLAAGGALSLLFVQPSAAPPVPPMPAVLGGMPQGHVYTGILEEPESLNPFTTRSAVARRYLLGFTHDTLVDLDPATGMPRGALAEHFEVAPGADAVVFTLRDGVRFCDGAPLRLEDVRFTWEVAQSPGVVLGSIGDGLRLLREVEFEAGPPLRVRAKLDRPHFAAAQAVGESWLVVQRRWVLDRIAAAAARSGEPVPTPAEPRFGELLETLRDDPGPGTGPYRFAVWRKGQDVLLQRNELCWRRSVAAGTWNLGGIRILFTTSEAAQFGALAAQQVDFFQAQDLDGILARRPELAAHYRKVVYDPAGLVTFVVQWNLRRPLLQDARVRRALGMLFDRRAIVDQLLQGNGRPAVCFAKPGSAEFPAELEPLPFDPPEARRLLRDSGAADREDGIVVRLLVPAGMALFRRIGDLAVDAGRGVGVEVRVQELEFKTLLARRDGDDWDGALVNVSFRSWIDPYDLFHSSGGGNVVALRDQVVDELLEQARASSEPQRRAAVLQQVHRRLHELQPMALLVHPRAALLLNVHLENAEPGPLGLWPERFCVQPEWQRAPDGTGSPGSR